MKKMMVVLALSLGVLGLVSATAAKPAQAGHGVCHGSAPYCPMGGTAVCVCDRNNECGYACAR